MNSAIEWIRALEIQLLPFPVFEQRSTDMFHSQLMINASNSSGCSYSIKVAYQQHVITTHEIVGIVSNHGM